MLYDRPYMQASSDRKGPSALVWLLIVIGTTYAGSHIASVFLPNTNVVGLLNETFGMSRENFRSGKIWTVLTYSFFHGGFFHILINGLIIFGIGRSLQAEFGEKQFLYLYFAGVLLGGIAIFIMEVDGIGLTIGASAGALALVTVYCFQRWDMPVTLLFFEITFKMKWLFFAILAFDALGYLLPLISQLSSPASFSPVPGTSHSAHLGGILAGFLFYKYLLAGQTYQTGGFNPGSGPSLPKWFSNKKPAAKPAAGTTRSSNPTSKKFDRKGLQAEVDRILDKINSQGFGALSEEEKKTLDRARDILSR